MVVYIYIVMFRSCKLSLVIFFLMNFMIFSVRKLNSCCVGEMILI